MEVTAAEDGQDANVTQPMFSHLVSQARRVRLRSWCVRVVVVSHDPAFLSSFAEFSLKGRLLVWATRLLVVTSLTLPQLYALLPAYWTFSMMNTIFLNMEDTSSSLRYRLYTYLPYGPGGAQVLRMAIWSPKQGIVLLAGLSLFPDKFLNFYGAQVNVTVLPWPPYWDEEDEEAPDGTVVRRYSGSDYLTLQAIAEALNFIIYVVPITTWYEAQARLSDRTSFIIPLNHMTLPGRWEQYDFTHTYEFTLMAFSLAKPGLKPRWQSLYYPLTDEVWAAILVVLIIMPALLYLVSVRRNLRDGEARMSMASVTLEVTGMLVGQNLPLRLPDISSSRLLLTVWLLFAFVIGVAYRGNLTAALTLPKFPPRPETVEQLVNTVDRVTAPALGREWKKFLAVSESKAFRKLAEILIPGPTPQEGLLMATKQNTAQMTDLRNMAYTIAKHFTRADGSSQLYLGREPIFPIPAGFPIPFDAPFKTQLDRNLMAIVESGLLKKWVDDTLGETRRKSQRKQREYLAQLDQEEQQRQIAEQRTESGNTITALTLTHMQGPLMLLLLSLVVSGITFMGEILAMNYTKATRTHSLSSVG
ncbi:ionotropic receptor 93a-like [Panulirus ornatus]|uniref:ionotropic receptor 93a-like n=1 Tax=Panulirus ornatus TaxID=150431 RepID=UPI003A857F11